tara:strand:+ start:264 stop:791 length:528 start_codon:yes stop_codon:yes gene_type:complete
MSVTRLPRHPKASITFKQTKEIGTMLKHRIYKHAVKSVSSILFSDVKGDGLNGYRNWRIRLALSTAIRIGWIPKGYLGHFERTLWQDAKVIMRNDEWSGSIASLMEYRFWRFISKQANDTYVSLAVKYRVKKGSLDDTLVFSDTDSIAALKETPAERDRRFAEIYPKLYKDRDAA